MNQIFQLDHVTELLQYFTSSAVTFATADNSIAATGIGSGFTAGDKIVISGAAESGNNATFTIVTVASGKLVVSETVTAESPTATVVINQEYQGNWAKCDQCAKIVGTVNCSGNAVVLVDQSQDKVNVDYTSTTDANTSYAVTGGTPFAFEVSVVNKNARLRIRNNGADQTAMRAYLNGRTVS
jgi:hypothetical protein